MTLSIIIASFLLATLASFLAKRRGIGEFASVFASILALVGTIVIARDIIFQGVYNSSQFFSVDALGVITMLLIACVGLATTAYSIEYFRQEIAKQIIGFTRVKQYYILSNLFFAAMFLTVTASSPIVTWISIEATTLSTAFLISFYNKPSAIEAAWKYLIINSVGLLFGFFGTLLYFTSVSSVAEHGWVSWQALTANATHIDPLLAKIAFIFVLIGYGTKIGLAPMHTWLPDAHSKASAPISALLSGVLLNVAFIVVLRFKIITDAVAGQTFSQNLLIIFGLLSIFVAALIILTQENYKRLLAYSSIENMGIMALGFGFGGIGAIAAILHMIYHSLIKSAIFLLSGNILLKFASEKIAKVRDIIGVIPVTGVLFFTGFFAITGSPPFGIFLTKITILSIGIKTHPIITGIAIVSMVIMFIGFLNHATAMLFGKRPEEVQRGGEKFWLIAPPLLLLIIAFCLSVYVPSSLHILLNDVAAYY